MTSKEVMGKIWNTPGSAECLMLKALIEIGLDWEAKIKDFPEESRQMLTITKELEWLSGILEQVTGLAWEELTK